MAELSLVRPVTAKSQACREEDTSGPCRWLFSAARPVGDVKSLPPPPRLRRARKALHRYDVVKAPAVGVITVWKWPAAFLEGHTSGPCRSLFSAARTVGDAWKNAPEILQGSHKGHYVSLLLLGQLPIEHEIKIFYRVLQREQPAVVQIGRRVLHSS